MQEHGHPDWQLSLEVPRQHRSRLVLGTTLPLRKAGASAPDSSLIDIDRLQKLQVSRAVAAALMLLFWISSAAAERLLLKVAQGMSLDRPWSTPLAVR